MTEPEPDKYSVFTGTEKWCIIAMVAYAAWSSTLSSFIYFPAIQALSEEFDVTADKVNSSAMCYMAVTTVTPTLVGDAADVQGRRVDYIAILSLYVPPNIALALVKSYAAHLGLRVVQALAISGKFGLRSFVPAP